MITISHKTLVPRFFSFFISERSLFMSIITYRKESGNEGGSVFFKYYSISYCNFLFNMKDGKTPLKIDLIAKVSVR